MSGKDSNGLRERIGKLETLVNTSFAHFTKSLEDLSQTIDNRHEDSHNSTITLFKKMDGLTKEISEIKNNIVRFETEYTALTEANRRYEELKEKVETDKKNTKRLLDDWKIKLLYLVIGALLAEGIRRLSS